MINTQETQTIQPKLIQDAPASSPTNVVLETPPAPSLKKVSLGGMTKKKKDAETSYPILPDPMGKAAEVATCILEDNEKFEALKGALETNKKFLIELAAPYHFKTAEGKILEKGIGILVEATGGRRVRVDFKNSYATLADDAAIAPILGDKLPEFFAQTFSIEIDGSKLPIAKAQDIITELQELFYKYNASDALSYKEGISPLPDFHLKRHALLTREQNMRLQEVLPIRAAVATKNVK